MPGTENWKTAARVVHVDGKVQRYSIVCLRTNDDGWYDEVRYDSHDRTRGRYRMAPLFHMKVRSSFKDDTAGAETELRDIIRKELPRIETVIRKQEVSE
jgi:hypothetical protein